MNKYISIFFIITLSLFIRCVHFQDINKSPLHDFLIGDETTHELWANSIINGEIEKTAPLFRAPLYGYVLAYLFEFSNHSYNAVRVVQMFFGIISIFLIFLIGKDFFSTFVSVLAGILLAIYPTLIYFEGQLLMENIFIFFSIAGLYCFLKFIKSNKSVYVYFCPFFWGLGLLTRANLIFVIPFFLVILISKFSYKIYLKFLIILISVISVTPLINYIYSNEFLLLPSQGGINFYAGNSKEADGLIPLAPNSGIPLKEYYNEASKLKKNVWSNDNMWEVSNVTANYKSSKILNAQQVSDWWYSKTFEEIKKDPIIFLKKITKKIFFLIGNKEICNNTLSVYCMEKFYPSLSKINKFIDFSFIWILFLPGCYIAWRKYPFSQYILAYLVLMSFVIIIFFVTTRYKMFLVPCMVLFSAVFIEYLVFEVFLRKKFSFKLINSIIILFIAVISGNIYKIYPESWQERASLGLFHNSLANAFYIKKDPLESLNEINKAIGLKTNEEFIFYLTKYKIEKDLLNDQNKALESLERSVELCEHPVTLLELAKVYKEKKQYENAEQIIDRLLSLIPDYEKAIILKKQLLNS